MPTYPVDYINLAQTGQQGPLTDGQRVPARANAYGALVTGALLPSYAELVQRGQVFAAFAPNAIIPNSATLTNAPTLFNRSTSGKVIYPLFINIGVYASGATAGDFANVPFGLIFLASCGDAPATGAPIATGTALTARNCLVGGAGSAKGQFMATIAFTASTSQTISYECGMGFWAGTSLTASYTFGTYKLVHRFEGEVGILPGNSIILATGNSLTGGSVTKTYNVTMIWAEVPAPTWIS